MVKASRHLCLFSRQPLLIIMVSSSEDRILQSSCIAVKVTVLES